MSDESPAKRFRSPPFPALSLPQALERAEQLYRQEREHLAPLASAAKAWNMSPTSSNPVVTVGALRQYALVEDEGSGATRKIRLTHDALRIILDKVPTSPSRQEALKRAFLAPKVFQELWSRWKADLPSDQTIINYLVLDRRLSNQAPFSEQSASELLANYRASMPFMESSDTPNVLPQTGDGDKTAELEPQAQAVARAEKAVAFTSALNASSPTTGGPIMEHERVLSDGLLSKQATYRLIVTGRIGLREIERLIKKLEIDKEILAEEENSDTAHD